MCTEMLGVTSVDNKVNNINNSKKIKGNKKMGKAKFESFLTMNAYDLALENPVRAYNFLLKEVMEGFEGSFKEKQGFFDHLMMNVIELLEENGYLKIVKNLSKHYKTQLMIKVEIKNNDIKTTLQRSSNFDTLDEESLFNVVEREYLYDFEQWLNARESRALLNFAYAFWVDGLEKEAKSFLKEQIFKEKERGGESKEMLLRNAVNYLRMLIKREIGNI